MKIVIIGGGPAGPYFGLVSKKQDPAPQNTLHGPHRPGRSLRLGLWLCRRTAGKRGGRGTFFPLFFGLYFFIGLKKECRKISHRSLGFWEKSRNFSFSVYRSEGNVDHKNETGFSRCA